MSQHAEARGKSFQRWGTASTKAQKCKKFFKFLMVSFKSWKREGETVNTIPDSLKGKIGRKDEKDVKTFQQYRRLILLVSLTKHILSI